jgi:dTMP kinase
MKRNDAGILIAVEGIDGAGKTTQVELLVQFLEKAGQCVLRSKEPTDGYWGQIIRRSAANGRLSVAEELTAFMEDRKQHLQEKILPALALGQTVVLDRYYYSTAAYQGVRRGNVEEILSKVLESAPEPDVVLLLDVPPEVGFARISDKRKETPNAFEGIDNLRAVRAVFLQLSNARQRICVIDGSKTIADVHLSVLTTLVNGVLKNRGCATTLYRAMTAPSDVHVAKRSTPSSTTKRGAS